jgi:hypothetical protein
MANKLRDLEVLEDRIAKTGRTIVEINKASQRSGVPFQTTGSQQYLNELLTQRAGLQNEINALK